MESFVWFSKCSKAIIDETADLVSGQRFLGVRVGLILMICCWIKFERTVEVGATIL